jgi:membrane fusion protein
MDRLASGARLLSQGLFRQEVLDARKGSWLGGIAVATPLSRWVIVAMVLAVGTALVLFLVLGHYTRRESVAGQLVPSTGLLNVAAPSAGTVSRVLVRDGQGVKAGQALLEISSEQESSALGDTHVLVGEQLTIQRARLQSDLLMQQQLASQQSSALKTKIGLLRAQLAQIADQLNLQQQQATSAHDLLERIRPLNARGYVSGLQIQQQESAFLEAQAQYKTLVRQQLDAQQQMDAAQQELAQLPLQASTRRNDIERQLATVSQSIAQNETQRAVVLRAPRDGVVSALLLKPGQMVGAAQPLLSILPAGSELQAQLLVPSRAIGFIAPGSRVVLRYQAFPYQKFGQQYGRVADISRSALTPAETGALVGQQAKEPLYRVQVALDNQHVQAYGKAEALKPGMVLEADVLMERRRLIEWVFEPLYGLGKRFSGGTSHG